MSQTTTPKAKIEAIYPLTAMQQGLLFHHLMSKNDQGFLHVQCKLEGTLDVNLLKKAWQATIHRHPVLRTSVHWKKMEKPIQVVRPQAEMNWVHHDWSNVSKEEQEQQLTAFKNKAEEKTINFEKGPLAKVSLIKLSEKAHYLIWNCHHLLLDGWSSSILLQDIFAFYEGFSKDIIPKLEAVPSQKAYLNWLQRIDPKKAAHFWNTTFNGVSKAPLFNPQKITLTKESTNHFLKLSEERTTALNALARKHKVTANSMFQGIWSLLLGAYFGDQNITFGTTVSGRTASFPNIELMAGMFMNVLPVNTDLSQDQTVASCFQKIQTQQQEARNYEHFTNDDITGWINWPSGAPLFDSLFIFENFPWKDMESAGVTVRGFESGVTTTYPMTFVVKTGNCLEINLFTNPDVISNTSASWFLENLERLCTVLIDQADISLQEVLSQLPTPENIPSKISETENSPKDGKQAFIAAKNKTELELTAIWETVFGIESISIHDNFFEIGGKSMLAVQMFSLIDTRMGVKLPPTTLLEHPTIAAIAAVLQGDKKVQSWEYIVPLRASGHKKPLFCVHGGGGHVFFYNPLANSLDINRPVYALQPSGIDGKENMHQSIEEMAISYAKEIMQIQPEGPYNLMVYCFSSAVGIEMAREFERHGKVANLIVADSLVEQEDFIELSRLKLRFRGFMKRIVKNPISGIRLMIINKTSRFIEPLWVNLFGSKDEKNLEKIKSNLIAIYNKYQWGKKHPGHISLILTDKSDKKINKEYIRGWQELSNKNVNVLRTEGNHLTLFEGTDVQHLAENIEKSILEAIPQPK
ncbi:condensation domain-containing protein [Spongiimicrobium salis]|uniref:condensation domain-containing protein n=1 Tax=Spongiimicrobium salis TaxID=1667022 RepID=UPI00374D7F03